MRKITLSLINLIIIIVLFAAATYAWFSDSALNQNNRIQVGNLKVSMVAADGLSFENPSWNLNDQNLQDLKTDSSPLFDFNGRVEPGQTLTRYIRIKNVGTIAMDYEVHFTVKESFLEDYIKFTISDVDLSTGTAGVGVDRLGSYFSNVAFVGTSLLQDQYKIHKVTITISEDLDNYFNNAMLSEDAFDFDVQLIAWQSLYPDSKPGLPISTPSYLIWFPKNW